MSSTNRRPVPEVDLAGAAWRKSTHSSSNGACVEIAFVDGVVALRDSKDTARPAMFFYADEWEAFLKGANDGEFQRP
jgi:hypothetical protein